ncbi:Eco47II family restriction endonuclease [Carboxylicivirga sp. N1Y90]|uniref:Eco47II family restriction endonuclease n=1 Tax=Carboxylicivirga fragile TaxID=3417571 RepID=UPI003D34E40E|nr:Eco47II family restriction endonuclease [Marinilabiliaceae bacterium N1Y90]
MANKYVDFISDAHFLECIENLHNSYIKAKEGISKRKFYSNKIDTIKLTFDAKFNNLSEESVIKNEIMRQMDKSFNNSIGTFHEQILGGINGYEIGNVSGYDIKATDDTLFADIKNKHNTMNSSAAESLFQKLARYADTYKKAKCYWVQILAKKSFCESWSGDINGKEYSHSRVLKISGDQFYALLTGQEDAFFALYKALPLAISDFLAGIDKLETKKGDSAISEIKNSIEESDKTIFDQITSDNFGYYLGFNEL